MITITADRVAPALWNSLKEIQVSSDGQTATVGGEKLYAESTHQLSVQLAASLYQLVHVGREALDTERPRTFRDPQVEALLYEATPHTTTVTTAILQAQVEDEAYTALLDGVRVLLPSGSISGIVPATLPGAVAVRIPAARPALSTGFFLVDGSSGTDAGAGSQTLRLYVHLTSAHVASVAWQSSLSTLERLGVRYRAKVTSAASMFPRRDGLVVYLGPDAWHAVPAIVESVSGIAGVGPTTSPFTHSVAPGVSIAWEPQDDRPGMRRMSFGEHRAAAVAEALIRHAVRTDEVGLVDTLVESLINAGIDPLAPARNLDSPALIAEGLV